MLRYLTKVGPRLWSPVGVRESDAAVVCVFNERKYVAQDFNRKARNRRQLVSPGFEGSSALLRAMLWSRILRVTSKSFGLAKYKPGKRIAGWAFLSKGVKKERHTLSHHDMVDEKTNKPPRDFSQDLIR